MTFLQLISKYRIFLYELSEVAMLNIVLFVFVKMSEAPGKDEAADGDEEDE